MARQLRVAIIGAGIGGLTAAACLRRVGVDVRIYEQARGFARLGAGIQQAPNSIRVLRALGLEPTLRALAFQPDAMSSEPVLPMSAVVTSYYLRLRVADQAGVLAKVAGILADCDISIDAVIQREADEIDSDNAAQTDLIILTHDCVESRMDAALARMQNLPTVLQNIVRIRKEELA